MMWRGIFKIRRQNCRFGSGRNWERFEEVPRTSGKRREAGAICGWICLAAGRTTHRSTILREWRRWGLDLVGKTAAEFITRFTTIFTGTRISVTRIFRTEGRWRKPAERR